MRPWRARDRTQLSVIRDDPARPKLATTVGVPRLSTRLPRTRPRVLFLRGDGRRLSNGTTILQRLCRRRRPAAGHNRQRGKTEDQNDENGTSGDRKQAKV